MQDVIATAKDFAIAEMENFLRVFAFVPSNKLTWTPTPTAKSALRIAAHTALYPARFARMIEERKLPAHDSLSEWLAQRNAEEAALKSRSEIERVFRLGTGKVIDALDGLTREAIAKSLDSGLGWSVPMTRLMMLPGLHAMSHSAQIDYLQTCWGDQEVHF